MSVCSVYRLARAGLAATALLGLVSVAAAAAPMETPALAKRVAAGELPPVAERLPEAPRVITLDGKGLEAGKHGGELHILMAGPKDVRQMVVYGYARLVCYDPDFTLQPDILESVDVEDDRVFTFHLRKGHKWSDGHPFTAEDFRYWWEDVANNEDLSPVGPPRFMVVQGEPAKFEVIDDLTVRYSWANPNPEFLPRLAGATPPFIYRPAHYLKQFHAKYQTPEALEEKAEAAGQRDWAPLHNKLGNMYRNQNVDLPSLQPWVNTTPGSSERYVFARNPYFHRIDQNGRQLPYIDRVMMQIANTKIIAAKTTGGETDLQARYLRFDNYAVLKDAAKRQDFTVTLWKIAKGSDLALFPNLTHYDPTWRGVLRDVRFRKALSMAIDRDEINQVIYFGLGTPSQNTVLKGSPLYKDAYRTAAIAFDIKQANALLDEMGLDKRNDAGTRLLPNGEPLQIIVETAGERTEEPDILELIRDSWKKIGVELFTKPLQREMLRNRIFAGETVMSVWWGMENGLPRPEMSPHELAPTSQHQFMWPKWGQYYETAGAAGEEPDMPQAKELMQLLREWRATTDAAEREAIWHKMLAIHAANIFSIGTIANTFQPVVVSSYLRNVPKKGIWNWDPGAHFGMYRPDTFWFDDAGRRKVAQGG